MYFGCDGEEVSRGATAVETVIALHRYAAVTLQETVHLVSVVCKPLFPAPLACLGYDPGAKNGEPKAGVQRHHPHFHLSSVFFRSS